MLTLRITIDEEDADEVRAYQKRLGKRWPVAIERLITIGANRSNAVYRYGLTEKGKATRARYDEKLKDEELRERGRRALKEAKRQKKLLKKRR